MIEAANSYHASGLSVISVNENKEATTKGWNTTRTEPNGQFRYAKNLAIVCGAISGGIEMIDIDCKYDITGTLYSRYKHAINEAAPDLLAKLVVEKTKNNGYHFIYKCEVIGKNQKLAKRYATSAETAKDHNEKQKVLLETRGEGGYFVCAPSEGYKLVHGKLEQIQTITPQERDILMECARSFNEIFVEKPITYTNTSKHYANKTPIDAYNESEHIHDLLAEYGWTIVKQDAKNIYYRRAGKTIGHSATYSPSLRKFYVFSTSTEFESETAYSPAAVYNQLKANGNWHNCVKMLHEAGYGEMPKKIDEQVIEPETDDYTFITDKNEIEIYITDCVEDRKIKGLGWGLPHLDQYFKFKYASFSIINGHQNVGKSTFLWYLLLSGSITNGLKWILYSPENKAGYITRKLIEFYWGKVLAHTTEYERKTALEFIYEHFTIIGDKEYFSYSDIIKAAEKTLAIKHFDGLLLDPYNALKIEIKDFRALGGHEYHYQAASLFRIFCKRYNCSLYLNTHSVTEAQRKKGADGKMPAPFMSDIEGGGKWGNKADDFLTLHRYVGDPSVGNETMVYVRKIKEIETGGKVTPPTEPLIYRFENWCRFIEEDGTDPIKLSKMKVPF